MDVTITPPGTTETTSTGTNVDPTVASTVSVRVPDPGQGGARPREPRRTAPSSPQRGAEGVAATALAHPSHHEDPIDVNAEIRQRARNHREEIESFTVHEDVTSTEPKDDNQTGSSRHNHPTRSYYPRLTRQEAVHPTRFRSPPCPLRTEGHNHSMGTCPLVFQMRGFLLRSIACQTHCLVCFGPAQGCELGCPFVSVLSRDFFCLVCRIRFPTIKPCTILMCGMMAHQEAWNLKDFLPDLKRLFPDFTAESLSIPLPPRPAQIEDVEDEQ